MNVVPIANNKIAFLPLDSIQEEVVQLRTVYDDESLSELASSYDEQGVIQPIVVAPAGGEHYELIIGSRRLRAARLRQDPGIPAIIVEQRSPLNYLLMALAENLQREDLNPFEEAGAFLRLLKDYGLSMKEISERTSKSENYVRRRMMLVSLPEVVQQLVAEKKLGLNYVDPLARLPSGEAQVFYAEKAVTHRLTTGELQAMIDRDSDAVEAHGSVKTLSAEKIRIRIEMFSRYIRRVSANKALTSSLNSAERAAIAKAIQGVEAELRTARSVFADWAKSSDVRAALPDSNVTEVPDNHGEEWSLRHVEKITADDRPSDEVLSVELGRTVGAIRAMRFKMQREKKSKAA